MFFCLGWGVGGALNSWLIYPFNIISPYMTPRSFMMDRFTFGRDVEGDAFAKFV